MSSKSVRGLTQGIEIARFLWRRLKYYRGVRLDSPLPEARAHVHNLTRFGVTVIPDLFPAAVTAEMLSSQPDRGLFSQSVEGDRSLIFPNAHALPSLRPFFEHQLIDNIVRSYIGRDAIPLRRSFEWRHTKGSVLAFDRLPHMDTWKHRLKAFLYLHDVGDTEAPMVYLRGSHRGSWRSPMEALIDLHYKTDSTGYAINETVAYLGCFWPYQVEELKRLYGYDEFRCRARAGSVLIFDARGLHWATELQADFRKILISYWVRKGHHT